MAGQTEEIDMSQKRGDDGHIYVEGSAINRCLLYSHLLAFFDGYGFIPEFSLSKQRPA